MKTLLITLLIALVIALATQDAVAATFTSSGGAVRFTAIGKPGFLKIKGTSGAQGPTGKVEVKNGEAKGEFRFALSSLDTGIDMRTEHMKEKYLEVSKYPEAKLTLNGFKITDGEIAAGVKKPFEGQLELHGVTKPVKGEVEIKPKGASATAAFSIQVSDYAVEIPKYMGVTVSEKVEIEIETALK